MSDNDKPLCPPPEPNPHPPHFTMPARATDCHAHVFGPASRYPYQEDRSYTPRDLPLSQLRAMHRTLGIERLVVVQASAHGLDNNAVLEFGGNRPQRICAGSPPSARMSPTASYSGLTKAAFAAFA